MFEMQFIHCCTSRIQGVEKKNIITKVSGSQDGVTGEAFQAESLSCLNDRLLKSVIFDVQFHILYAG